MTILCSICYKLFNPILCFYFVSIIFVGWLFWHFLLWGLFELIRAFTCFSFWVISDCVSCLEDYLFSVSLIPINICRVSILFLLIGTALPLYILVMFLHLDFPKYICFALSFGIYPKTNLLISPSFCDWITAVFLVFWLLILSLIQMS